MINAQTVVTKATVNECAQRVLTLKSDYYMELFDRQSKSRKQLLKALTLSGEYIFSSAYIKTHRLPAVATLQRAVNELIKDGIIEKSTSGYFITDPFFKLFVSGM
jgi:hypothetical protein